MTARDSALGELRDLAGQRFVRLPEPDDLVGEQLERPLDVAVTVLRQQGDFDVRVIKSEVDEQTRR